MPDDIISCVAATPPDVLDEIAPDPDHACRYWWQSAGALHVCMHGAHPAHGSHPERHRCVCGATCHARRRPPLVSEDVWERAQEIRRSR